MIFAFDIRFALINNVVAELECGDINREGGIEKAEFAGGSADSCDGATDEVFAKKAGAGVVWKDLCVTWCGETAIGTPEIVDNRRDGAIVSVARDCEIETTKESFDFLVEETKRRVCEGEFDLVWRKIVKFVSWNFA